MVGQLEGGSGAGGGGGDDAVRRFKQQLEIAQAERKILALGQTMGTQPYAYKNGVPMYGGFNF